MCPRPMCTSSLPHHAVPEKGFRTSRKDNISALKKKKKLTTIRQQFSETKKRKKVRPGGCVDRKLPNQAENDIFGWIFDVNDSAYTYENTTADWPAQKIIHVFARQYVQYCPCVWVPVEFQRPCSGRDWKPRCIPAVNNRLRVGWGLKLNFDWSNCAPEFKLGLPYTKWDTLRDIPNKLKPVRSLYLSVLEKILRFPHNKNYLYCGYYSIFSLKGLFFHSQADLCGIFVSNELTWWLFKTHSIVKTWLDVAAELEAPVCTCCPCFRLRSRVTADAALPGESPFLPICHSWGLTGMGAVKRGKVRTILRAWDQQGAFPIKKQY